MRRRRSAPPRATAPRGRGRGPQAPRGYQPPPLPPTLVAEVVNLGAHLRGRVLHKELAALEWRLHLPKALQVEAGCFVQGTPHPTERNLLVVHHTVPASRAAVAAALANHALPTEFSKAALQAAEALPAYRWHADDGRDDWRALPFLTIDGEDAKDFDDAVWAAPWHNTQPGPYHGPGHHVRVAIADVTHYVAPGSVLDDLAKDRGNSTYFPGHVVPMLPERLSNDLCSLNPATDKPVLAAELWLSAHGTLLHYRFCRAVIHSARRCTYTEVQAQLDGKPTLPPVLHPPVRHLHAAYQALLAQRTARGAINLELPELQIQLNAQGRVQQVAPRPRLAAHMLIEELMIAANVAAATALSMGCADTRPSQPRRHQAVAGVYRVHAQPSKEKLEGLRSVLTPLGFTAPPPNARPSAWAALATRVQQHPAAPTLQRALLQAQMQAQYTPENIGHFGLALPLYTHFTSPIRRYADVLVHRALLAIITREGTPPDSTISTKLQTLCSQLNLCERRSQQAEWEARDRLTTGWLASQVGQVFQATVTNVAPFGCFVSLGETGAEALLPKWHLEDYVYVGGTNCFRRTHGGKGQLRAGSTVAVKLLQADFAAGRLTVGLA
ncbi:MAG: VacB/RNase II family 3'-5' exoribonuclease, partial [Alphaproteobacteria bacterium]|nr:VacB/RNase II family 3'-5' exoribonuclease [Alphaproteobacteria bacterium]